MGGSEYFVKFLMICFFLENDEVVKSTEKSPMYQVWSLDTNYIELRFHSENPYSHHAFGELCHSNYLLLHIWKRKIIQYAPTSSSKTTFSSCGTIEISIVEGLIH